LDCGHRKLTDVFFERLEVKTMKALIAGGSGGIGRALVEAMCQRPGVTEVLATYHRTSPPLQDAKLSWHCLDLKQEEQIAMLLGSIDRIDYVINAAGMLHRDRHMPEKALRQLDPSFFMDSIAVNTLPTLLLAKHSQRPLGAAEQPVFASISARVGSIVENRMGGWYSYRSSKAALNMALKTLSLEWGRSLPHCTVAALHPGTNDTSLSAPFQKAVPTHKLFPTQRGAQQLLKVIDGLSPDQSGRFWSWDGTELPW
jgi:NAD(P)-dependent dehydrogenase (short-subunit alcohol dehydrogenase family)